MKNYLLFICFFVLLLPVQSNLASKREEQQLIPFIGMVLEYQFDVTSTEKRGESTVIIPMLVNWTIYYELYNESNPEIFISNLILEVSVLSMIPLEKEIGFIVENITSRRVLQVNVADTILLSQLYSTYYSPDAPNYTPFYINTTNIEIGQDIGIYNYTMTVISQERIPVVLRDIDLGYKDAFLVEFYQESTYVDHFITLLYDLETGVLLAGRLLTTWHWGDYYVNEIDAKLFIKRTNALTEKIFAVDINNIFILITASFPLIALIIKILKMKEVQGGL